MTTAYSNLSPSDPLRKTYNSWRGMKERCSNPKNSHWHIYGAKNIRVCESWLSFDCFLKDMGFRPDGMTLDRIDGNLNYEPGNCRWATPKQQSRNTDRNIWIEWDGRRQTIKDWSAELGLFKDGLKYRIARWGIERAMTTGKLKNGAYQQVLTDEQVLEARKIRAAMGMRYGSKALGDKYGVTASAVIQAVSGKTFKHLPSWETFAGCHEYEQVG